MNKKNRIEKTINNLTKHRTANTRLVCLQDISDLEKNEIFADKTGKN